MEIFTYKIKLIDPLFYSKEGLAGAISPKYLHATAVNYAVAYAFGINPEVQPYIISEENGGRNIPRYENSIASQDFYFTPGRPVGSVKYIPEFVKGEDDNFVRLGYGASTGKAEVLKASQLFSIPPESIFEGYLITKKEREFPSLIRLGSFRGKAELQIGPPLKVLRTASNKHVNHPVDPLVSKVKRGVMINMFPYPIIENALVEDIWETKHMGRSEFVAIPTRKVEYNKDELLKRLQDLNPGISKAKDPSSSLKDRAFMILHMLRTALSVKLFLIGISGEERLDSALREIEDIETIRLASKGENIQIENYKLLGIIKRIEGIINDCEKKIKGVTKSSNPENTRRGSSSIIL